MRTLLISLFLCISFSYAQPTCVELIEAWEDATATAFAYEDVVSVTQGDKEVFYQEGFSTRNGEEWNRTVNVERSSLPFDLPGGPGENERDEDEEGAEEFCEGASVEAQGENWLVRPVEDDDSPIQDSTLLFEPYEDSFIPTLIEGRFDLKILLIPLRGNFSTVFKNWRFDLNYVSPRDR